MILGKDHKEESSVHKSTSRNGRIGAIPHVLGSIMPDSRSDMRVSKGLMSFTWHFSLRFALTLKDSRSVHIRNCQERPCYDEYKEEGNEHDPRQHPYRM